MDDDQAVADEADAAEGEAEYAFEGYKLEFNERVALTPPAPAAG